MSAFASNFNIVSMAMLTFMQRMGVGLILCICVFINIASIIFEMQMPMLTLMGLYLFAVPLRRLHVSSVMYS